MLRVKLVRSKIGCTPKQRKTLFAMGLHKREQCKSMKDNPCVRGMLRVVEHLVEVK
ncbi:MAG: 50S ribosomal protein L30 [Desulfovibrionaceae bacterium]